MWTLALSFFYFPSLYNCAQIEYMFRQTNIFSTQAYSPLLLFLRFVSWFSSCEQLRPWAEQCVVPKTLLISLLSVMKFGHSPTLEKQQDTFDDFISLKKVKDMQSLIQSYIFHEDCSFHQIYASQFQLVIWPINNGAGATGLQKESRELSVPLSKPPAILINYYTPVESVSVDPAISVISLSMGIIFFLT